MLEDNATIGGGGALFHSLDHIFICWGEGACHSAYEEIGRQLAGVSFLVLCRTDLGSSGHQVIRLGDRDLYLLSYLVSPVCF